MVPGQYRAGEIVEAGMTCLAMIALPMPLAFIMAVADDHSAVAARTAHAIRPAMLTHKLKAFGLVQQAGEIDMSDTAMRAQPPQTTGSRFHPIRSETWSQRYPARATTPEPDKSLVCLRMEGKSIACIQRCKRAATCS